MSAKGTGVSSDRIFEQISELAREFRKQISRGKSPRIEKYLNEIAQSGKENLFSNLLEIELRYRQSKGDSPTSCEYVKRFPKFESQIRRAFFEPTMVSIDLQASTDGDDHTASLSQFEHGIESYTPTFKIPATNYLGDFELIRELGKGGMGVVYEARHTKNGNRVALKTLPAKADGQQDHADRLYRFRKEFRSLSEINHPNLIGMQSLEVDHDQWFFTMDLVDGCTFLEFVCPNGVLDESRLRDGLQQLAAGIIALHRRGIIHRDLKPSNVLVDKIGRVVILDFGLVASFTPVSDQTASIGSRVFAGTPMYASPEQMFGEWSPASDWYAVGIMLFQALTGTTPFAGNPLELLRAKQEYDSPRLSGRAGIADDLAELTDELLRRSPSQRPDSDRIAMLLKFDQDPSTHNSQPTSHDSSTDGPKENSSVDASVVLVGRDLQLKAMEAARHDVVETGKPGLVWIRGLSGEGKSALAEAFLSPLRHGQQVLVLSGRCYDRESFPFKAIDCLIDPLVAFLRTVNSSELDALLPEDTPFLGRLFPMLQRVDTIASRCSTDLKHIDSQQVTARAFEALRLLLRNLSRRTPLVILIDDLQWGDTDSARVLFDLLRGRQPPSMLVLASYRRDEADNSPFLAEWKRQSESGELEVSEAIIDVHPLTHDQCLELAVLRTGLKPDALQLDAPELLGDSGGNPYFIEQLLTGIDRDSGSLRRMKLDEIVASRLEGLPQEAKRLLEVVAISGQPLSLMTAIKSAELDASVVSTATRMRSERLFRFDEADENVRVDTYHDKIRESVLRSMEADQQSRWHLKLAETLEADEALTANEWFERIKRPVAPGDDDEDVPAKVFDLAYHFLAAGDDRAFVYQLMAAERSMLAFAVNDALVHYDRVQSLLPKDAPSALQTRVFLGQGRVLHWSKDLPRANETLRAATELACEPVTMTLAYCRLSNLIRHRRTYLEAVEWMDRGLERLGFRRSQWTIFKFLSIFRHSFRALVVPSRLNATRSDEKRLRFALGHRLLENGQLLVESDAIGAVEAMLLSSIAAMRTGTPKNIKRGMAEAAYTFALAGAHPFARRMLRRSEAIELQTSDLEHEGFLVLCRAMALYLSGSLADADIEFERANDLFARCLVSDFEAVSTHLMRHVAAYLSPSSVELRYAQKVLRIATEAGHSGGRCWGRYDQASALGRMGRLEEAWPHLGHACQLLRGEVLKLTESICNSVVAFVRLQSSDYVGAQLSASHSRSSAFRNASLNDVTLFSMPLELEAACGPQWTQQCEPKDRKTIRRILRRNAMTFSILPNHQPHMLRAAGRAATTIGNTRKGVRSLEKAVKLSKRKGMDYQLARCLLDLAAVKDETREANRAEAIGLLKKMESVIPRAESWLLGDQFDEEVVAPEFDLEAWERENGSISSSNHFDR